MWMSGDGQQDRNRGGIMHSWFAELIAPDVDDVLTQQALEARDAQRNRARRLKNLQVKTVRRGP
jgi:hypothetical protein